MLLENKNAVVYGGGGAIGSAVARAFGREGARVFLAGRTPDPLDRVAGDIRAAGGTAETAVVDALDAAQVDAHADEVVAAAGSLDVSFNLVGHPYKHGTPLVDMDYDDVVAPLLVAVRTTWLTARAAARHMAGQGGGAILAFGGYGDPPRNYYIGGTQLAFQAIESLRRQLSAELGRDGVRFVTLQTSGIPESADDPSTREAISKGIEEATLLGRAATLEDVGNAAAFAASEWGRTMTGAALNISCGAFVD